MDNDCVQTITSHYSHFTASEKKVADFLIGNLQEAVKMSIREISERVGVSEATIVRFSRTIGYDGYRSLCIQMAQKMSYKDDYVMDIDHIADNIEHEINRVLMASMQAIKLTMEGLDYKFLSQAAEIMIQSRSVIFFGVGTSGIVCQDAMLKFLRINKLAFYFADYHAAVVAVSNLTSQDLVVGISHSGKSTETCELLELAKKVGAHTISVTTYPNERISKASDLILQTFTRESPLHKVAITSRTSQLAMIDSLFIATIMANYDNAMPGVLRVSDNITAIERQAYGVYKSGKGNKSKE